MKRRNFVAGVASAAIVAATVKASANGSPDDWHRIADETNTFGPDDTLEVRLRKFNELTGLGLTISEPCGLKYRKVHMTDKHGKEFRVEDQSAWRRFVYPDGRSTGTMDEETMMHWTAQVGFGYRLAKAQGL